MDARGRPTQRAFRSSSWPGCSPVLPDISPPPGTSSEYLYSWPWDLLCCCRGISIVALGKPCSSFIGLRDFLESGFSFEFGSAAIHHYFSRVILPF